jgi:type VI protein secretion system component Hcp
MAIDVYLQLDGIKGNLPTASISVGLNARWQTG